MSQAPHLAALAARYEEAGLAVVGVTNEDEELVRKTVERVKIAYPVALTSGNAADQAYGVRAVPRAFLIDREGLLVWSGHPASIDEALLEKLLGER